MIYPRLVKGESMLPTLRPGQVVWISQSRHFKVGDVVVAYVNRIEVIKRVAEVKDGKVFLVGDNPHQSSDSRQYGWVVDVHIMGKVVWPRVSKPALQ